jgi:hypothetical protein
MKIQTRKPGLKHPLRLYQRLYGMFRWPTLLLTAVCYGAWLISFDIPFPPILQIPLIVIAAIAWIVFIFTLIAPGFYYVQCHPNYVVISAVYPLAISYSRIGNTVPVNFATKHPFRRQSWSEQRLLAPLFYEQGTGQLTVVAMQLKGYPLPPFWLRFWFHKYMFFPYQDGPGFLFNVRNWMALSHEIEDYREAWRERRMARRLKKGGSVASQVLKKGERRR